MSTPLAPRLVSFALATLVTWTVFAGIDTMALEQQLASVQLSQASPATPVAERNQAAARS